MLICKGKKSYKCNNVKWFIVGETLGAVFSILEPISPTDIANLFEDNTFYFYDEMLNDRLQETDNTKMVGLRIYYNADSTCRITIKLTKGAVDNEGKI